MLMPVSEAARQVGVCGEVIYSRCKKGLLKGEKAPWVNRGGRKQWILSVDLDEVRALLESERREAEEKAREREAREREYAQLRASRAQQLKKARTGAAAEIVKGAGTKSVKQLARELGISTAEVMRIYEEEGCL